MFIWFFEQFAKFIVKWICVADILCGTLLLLLFSGLPGLKMSWLYYFFAVILGICLVGNQTSSLRIAINQAKQTSLRQNLSTFNALKVIGTALGFVCACFLAGDNFFIIFGRLIISIVGILLIYLAVVYFQRFHNNFQFNQVTSEEEVNNLVFSENLVKTISGICFIIVDLVVFNFWYSYIPAKLTKMPGITEEFVGIFLAIQCLTHAGGQFLWRRICTGLGEIYTYLISLSAHVIIVFIITSTFHYTISEFMVLFLVMGIVNSGTYIASTTWYYSSGYPVSKYSRIAVHQIASNIGKWIGTGMAIWIIK
ncbi:hypothetical protein ACEYW6_35925 [Nostoc sp. UIC 10607]